MASKYSRSGGKYTGTHTSLIPAAAMVCDNAHACAHVTRISPGFIKTGLKSVQGNRRLKIAVDGARILLTVRDNVSQQEVHVYAADIPSACMTIARGARQNNLTVIFRKET